MAPHLLFRLRLPHKPSYIITHGLDGQAITHVRESCKRVMTVQCLKHGAPIPEPEVLVILIRAYNPVVG